jgi:hypothetical protein
MLIGSGASIFVSVGAFKLYTSTYEVPGPEFPAPTAEIWLDMAKLVMFACATAAGRSGVICKCSHGRYGMCSFGHLGDSTCKVQPILLPRSMADGCQSTCSASARVQQSLQQCCHSHASSASTGSTAPRLPAHRMATTPAARCAAGAAASRRCCPLASALQVCGSLLGVVTKQHPAERPAGASPPAISPLIAMYPEPFA